MSRLERLLNLTAVLLNTTTPVSAEELQRLVEGYPEGRTAFHRAFSRDKEDLRLMGIPLRLEPVPGAPAGTEGYRIAPEDYYLQDPGLDPEELAALHLATMMIQTDAEGAELALWKLGGGSAPSSTDIGTITTVDLSDHTVPLFDAIRRRHPVRFSYRAVDRTVDPWRLHFQRGRWYLSGYDWVREAERNFRVDRIEGSVTVIEDQPWSQSPPADRTVGQSLRAWEFGAEDPIAAELLVDSSHADWAARELGPAATRHPDARGEVFRVAVYNRDGFVSFVAGLLDHAEILGPPDLRAHYLAWLGAIVERGA